MSDHPLKTLIEAADRSISAKDFDGLMQFYADDATLVVKAGIYAKGKDQIRRAFEAISAYFQGKLKVRQGKMEVIEGDDTALVIMETWLDISMTPALRHQPCAAQPMCSGGTRRMTGCVW